MSQNSHQLLLFFSSDDQARQLLQLLQALQRDEPEHAQQWAQRLDLDLSHEWHTEWFNQELSARAPGLLRLNFDAGNSDVVPLSALKKLFDRGLKAAVLQTFIDQAGELHRHYFLDGQWVNRGDWAAALPALNTVVDAELPLDDDEPDPSRSTPQPVSLQQWIDRDEQRQREAREMVAALTGFARDASERGVGIGEAAKSFLVIRGLFKGVLQGAAFMVITLVMFKGVWLWVGLGLLLMVLLALYHATAAMRLFAEPTGSEDAAS